MIVCDGEGTIVERVGAEHAGEQPDQFLWPHGIVTRTLSRSVRLRIGGRKGIAPEGLCACCVAQAVDGRGGLYVADVSFSTTGAKEDPAREMVSLHKWQRASTAVEAR